MKQATQTGLKQAAQTGKNKTDSIDGQEQN
jgi:hypothetical protein